MDNSRLVFFESISGIKYPEMIVDFFDHFIALKEILSNYRSFISVLDCDSNSVTFSIRSEAIDQIINAVRSLNGSIVIYGRVILIGMDVRNSTGYNSGELEVVIKLSDK